MPNPSESESWYQVLPTPSSTSASQSLSAPSQTSLAPGWLAESTSSQSSELVTYPAGASQAATWNCCPP